MTVIKRFSHFVKHLKCDNDDNRFKMKFSIFYTNDRKEKIVYN